MRRVILVWVLVGLWACSSDDGSSSGDPGGGVAGGGGLAGDPTLDSDGDGLTDINEVSLGLNPNSADTDGDGIPDDEELALGTDPGNADSDGDGVSDGDELAAGTDPGSDGSITPLLPPQGGTTSGGDLAGSEACTMADVVIAVDGSESMTEELEAMRNTVFPAFAERLQVLGGGLDSFRVATLDACPDPANFHTRGASAECNFDGGNAWIEHSSPAIDAEFACVGDIYQADRGCTGDNDDEQPASAIATAFESPYVDGPNASFARGEALLIAIAITDEDEQPTSDAKSADQIYQRLIGIKGGDVRRMVFLGIGGSDNCQGAYGDADRAVVLRQVTDRFIDNDRGVWWDLCQGRLEDGLEQAFQVIERACRELPPGEAPPPPGDTPGGGDPGNPPGSGDGPGDDPGGSDTPSGGGDTPSDDPSGGPPSGTDDCDGLDADCAPPPPPQPCTSTTSLFSSGGSFTLGTSSSGTTTCPSGTPYSPSGPGPD